MIYGELVHQLTGVTVVVRSGLPWRMAVEVGGVSLFDPNGQVPAEPGAVLLAVGAGVEQLPSVFAAAEACGAGCIIIGSSPVELSLDDDGVPVLQCQPLVSWDEVYGLVAAASLRPSHGSVAEASDLFDLANVLALEARAPAIIEDADRNVLAYSSIPGQVIDPLRQDCINTRHVPRTELADWAYREVERGAGSVRFGAESYRAGRAAIAIRSGDQLLGSVWVADTDGQLSQSALDLMPEIAAMAAFHLLRERSWRRHTTFTGGDAADRLLRGTASPELLESWERACAETVVVAIECALPDRAASMVWAARASSSLTTYLGAYRMHHAVTSEDGCVYVVLGARAKSGTEPANRVSAAVAHLNATFRIEIRAAIGPAVVRVSDVPSSRRMADEALAVQRERPDMGSVVVYDDVRSAVLFNQLAHTPAADAVLADPVFVRFVKDDPDAALLLTYLDTLGDTARTAAMSRVHPNTVRYRLRRFTEATGVDLDHPRRRTEVMWALSHRYLRDRQPRPVAGAAATAAPPGR
jgi:GAF domain-containing protein